MICILVDYVKIIDDKSNIKRILRDPPKKEGFCPGLILVIGDKFYNILLKIQKGEKRVNYINSDNFIDNVIDNYYIMYDEKRNICILDKDCDQHLSQLITNVLPLSSTIFYNIQLNEKDLLPKAKKIISEGFYNPYISIKDKSIVFIKENKDLKRKDNTVKDVLYILSQYKSGGDHCYLHAKLSPKSVNFLKSASKIGITRNANGKKSQKELTGELVVKDIINNNDRFVFIIDVNKDSIEHGEEENVDVSSTRYNFHSHPKEAYIRHSVNKAWPSVTDYLGYYKLGNNTIFHCVATLEGIYIISFSSYWCSNLEKVSKKFIDKNFDIDHKQNIDPDAYVKKINSIMFEGYPIFELKFLSWSDAGREFKVSFAKTGGGCISSERVMQTYRKLTG